MLFQSQQNRECSPLNWFNKQILNIIKCGTIPRHVGFIMDGNRRFSKKNKLPTIQGHVMGSERVSDILEYCDYLGIPNVTIYLFSIENFKRTQAEVDGLIKLAISKYEAILKNVDQLNHNEYCVRTIGNLSMIPEELKRLMYEVYLKTKHHKNFLNVAFAYTSRDEICRTMKTIASACESRDILEDEIDMDFFDNVINTPKLDILIRTSGEVRLSDFMLWQSNNTVISFIDAMWPELTIWHFIYCILKFQRHISDFRWFEENISQHKTLQGNERKTDVFEKYKLNM